VTDSCERSRTAAAVKALAESKVRKPEGGKTQEGNGLAHRLNPGDWAADSDADESPEGGDQRSGAGGQLLAAKQV